MKSQKWILVLSTDSTLAFYRACGKLTDCLAHMRKYVHKHVLYSANILRNFQRRSCCKEITENSQKIVRPHRGVIISVVIRSGGQPSWSSAPLENSVVHFFRRCFFHLWDSAKNRASETPNRGALPIFWLNAERKSPMATNFKGHAKKIGIGSLRTRDLTIACHHLTIAC